MMMAKLEQIQVDEVSLVDKAANKRVFLVLKREGSMPNKKLTLECEEGMEDILKAAVVKNSDLDVAIDKAGLSDKAKASVKAALNMLNAVKAELPGDILSKLSKLGGFELPVEKVEVEKIVEKIVYVEKKMDKKDEPIFKMKDDGTPDFDSVAKGSRAMVEALWKQNQEAQKTAKEAVDKADKIAKDLAVERHERVVKEFVAKAETFDKLPIKADEFGLLLKAASDNLTEEQYTELDRVLKAANEGMQGVFEEKGSSGDSDNAKTGLSKLEAKAKEIAKRDNIPDARAFTKALDENPDLAKQERDERGA